VVPVFKTIEIKKIKDEIKIINKNQKNETKMIENEI
jgi:hypothetical protein